MYNSAMYKEFQDEEMVFKSKPEQQKAAEDAQGLAAIMVRMGLQNPEDAFAQADNVKYWQYLKTFHSKYLHNLVFPEAKKRAYTFTKDFMENPEHYVATMPQGAPAPGAPAGGAGPGGGAAGAAPPAAGSPPPATGSTNKKTIESFVLPDGKILVRNGSIYSVRANNETISFSAEQTEAIAVAMSKIAARETRPMSGSLKQVVS